MTCTLTECKRVSYARFSSQLIDRAIYWTSQMLYD